MHRSWRASVLVSLASISIPGGAVFGEDWPNFRGPNHDGISGETGLKTSFSGSLPVLWERVLGDAYSSFACVGDRVYTCGTKDKHQVLLCLDAESGELIWERPFEAAFKNNWGSGTRATPTVDDGRVYIHGAHGLLLCADADTGDQLWTKQFKKEPKWGYAGSVLIEGEMAITMGGTSQGSLVALDKKTGKRIWKCGKDAAGYATPYPFTFQGKRYIVGFTARSVIIALAETGKLAAKMEWKTDYDVNAAAPIYHDGHLFITSGYKTGSAVFKLSEDGKKLALTEVWRSKVILNKFQSCILHEGHLYTSDQKALVCVDFLTGERRWRKPRVKNGTLILADGKLLLFTEQGELQMAPVSSTEFAPMATAKLLSGQCWTIPVLHDGRLYARNMNRMVCVSLTE